MTTQAEVPPTITVPEGFRLHSENTSHILLPDDNGAFLNPVQEFNRDMSVACIRTWGEQTNEFKKQKWEQARERKAQKLANRAKRQKLDGSEDVAMAGPSAGEQAVESTEGKSSEQPAQEKTETQPLQYTPQKFIILEALSATGLRSIRYAKEISSVKYVIANDLSPSAAEAMRRNVELNGLGPTPATDVSADTSADGAQKPQTADNGKVRVNEGDAWCVTESFKISVFVIENFLSALMYNHRSGKDRVDVVDLDPFSNYGGMPVKAEYCHEVALRLALNTISNSAARYGRYIQPLLSLSIDFYIRVFVRVTTAPVEVKKLASKTAMYYVCSNCQSFYEQPLGRVVEKVNESNGNVNTLYKVHAGPPVSNHCPECNSVLHIAGPMWAGPLHDKEFVSKVLEHVENNEDSYGTVTRMKGMLTVAKEELPTPFYFTPSKVAGMFHCECPPLDDVASAILHAGYDISRSHACAGSLKTTATRADIHDIFRSWVKKHPVRMDKISETSPARVLLAKEPKSEANFAHHPKSVTSSSKVKLVRYQQNPLPNWGPAAKAKSGKRKRDGDEA
ncbi:hypothetical protein EIP86_004233 [Pleurotus ostreatoroseus]|nr:hypothetical protein EIP86_004233 [Pleurotus ostreatoroseus]